MLVRVSCAGARFSVLALQLLTSPGLVDHVCEIPHNDVCMLRTL